MDKLKKITLSGKTYPLKCDLNVLEKLQEQFGTINEFERQILGIRYTKDESGNQIYTKDGTPLIRVTEPSIKSIKAALICMIEEGLEIEASAKGSQLEEINESELIARCDMSYELLAKILHDEYKKCFVTKKE